MSPQYSHQLPNGERLNVIDIESALKYLAALIEKYEEGYEEPLIIGDAEAAKAVVLPIGQWLDLLDVADQAAADEHIADEARKNLADPRPPVPYDDFVRDVQEVQERARDSPDEG